MLHFRHPEFEGGYGLWVTGSDRLRTFSLSFACLWFADFFWHQLLHSVSNMTVSIWGIISFSLWPESKISSLVWQIQKILEGLWRAKLDHVLPSVARGQICYWKVSGRQKHFTLHVYFLLKYTNVFPSSKAHPQMYSNCRCYNYFNWYPFSLPPYYLLLYYLYVLYHLWHLVEFLLCVYISSPRV